MFWALRGGGAGSWGVIIDATLVTFPIFNATVHTVNILTATLDQTASLMTTHAKHVRDWDQVRAGQYFILTGSTNGNLALSTIFKDLDGDASKAQMASFLADATKVGAVVQGETTFTTFANDIVGSPDDLSGINGILSSRLVPEYVYSDTLERVGATYKQLLSQGIPIIIGAHIAGGAFCFRDVLWSYPELTTLVGQVAANAHIDSAVIPAWRLAKALVSVLLDTVVSVKFDRFCQILTGQSWEDSLSAADIQALRRKFTATVRPVLEELAGGECSGSYSNEGDVLEPNFQVTFFGANYARLEKIKAAYDPHDLFIVPVGVRSEFWDSEGMCTV